MSEERTRILDMLSNGKISVAEAEKLLNAIGEQSMGDVRPAIVEGPGTKKPLPKYLRVVVDGKDKVNIRIPFQLLRSGMKLMALIPAGVQDQVNSHLKDHGVNFDLSKIKSDDLDEFVQILSEMTIDVNGAEEKVRVFCE
jgi:hypothetical protein